MMITVITERKGVYYYPVTNDQIDKVRNAYKKTFINNRFEIVQIVTEETMYFFEGQKDIDEVCEVIQSRVQLKLEEK